LELADLIKLSLHWREERDRGTCHYNLPVYTAKLHWEI